jgi:hypothetical protein
MVGIHSFLCGFQKMTESKADAFKLAAELALEKKYHQHLELLRTLTGGDFDERGNLLEKDLTDNGLLPVVARGILKQLNNSESTSLAIIPFAHSLTRSLASSRSHQAHGRRQRCAPSLLSLSRPFGLPSFRLCVSPWRAPRPAVSLLFAAAPVVCFARFGLVVGLARLCLSSSRCCSCLLSLLQLP